jgi:hypothetical protein
VTVIALSVVIAVIAAGAALWAAVNVRGFLPSLCASLVMGLAVSGMHYTGMAAVSVELHMSDHESIGRTPTSLKIRHLEHAGHGAGVIRCSCTRAGRGRLSELKIVCRFGDRSSSDSTACKDGRPYAIRAGGASGGPGCGTGRS